MPKETLVVTKRIRALLAEVGQQMKRARESRALTTDAVATALRITPARIRRAEAGDPGVAIGAYAMLLAHYKLEHQLELLAQEPRQKSSEKPHGR